jgi:hypothetical protein
MDEEKPPKRQTTTFIVERLREGFGYDEIAREQKLSERRVRQIVKQALEGREALESAIDRRGAEHAVAAAAAARGPAPDKAPVAVTPPIAHSHPVSASTTFTHVLSVAPPSPLCTHGDVGALMRRENRPHPATIRAKVLGKLDFPVKFLEIF